MRKFKKIGVRIYAITRILLSGQAFAVLPGEAGLSVEVEATTNGIEEKCGSKLPILDAEPICLPGATTRYGRDCDECCNGITYDAYTVGNGKDNAKECCASPETMITDTTTEISTCCPEGTTTLYGSDLDKCCNGTPYNLSTKNYNGSEQGMDYIVYESKCCEAPDAVAVVRDTRNQHINKPISASFWQTISDRESTCVSCLECETLYGNVINTLAELGNENPTRPSSATPNEIKSDYEKYNQKHCEVFNKTFNCTSSTPTTPEGDASSVGITCTKDQMIYGQCKFDVYKTIGIRKGDTETSVGIFVQDIILSATMFIGTIVTIAIIVSGLMFVFGGANPDMQSKAKTGLINAFIGLILVMSSYFVIRLVQYIVKGE